MKNEVKNGRKILTFIKHTTKCYQTQQSLASKYWSCLQGFTFGQKMVVKCVLKRPVILGSNPASPTKHTPQSGLPLKKASVQQSIQQKDVFWLCNAEKRPF
ncbi:MAG: hypothetical protein JNN25_10660 [Candidatus Kapabacteria bacterium]|nr:hypothetical protein [Candidatus Kapabacteria bacterium]